MRAIILAVCVTLIGCVTPIGRKFIDCSLKAGVPGDILKVAADLIAENWQNAVPDSAKLAGDEFPCALAALESILEQKVSAAGSGPADEIDQIVISHGLSHGVVLGRIQALRGAGKLPVCKLPVKGAPVPSITPPVPGKV